MLRDSPRKVVHATLERSGHGTGQSRGSRQHHPVRRQDHDVARSQRDELLKLRNI